MYSESKPVLKIRISTIILACFNPTKQFSFSVSQGKEGKKNLQTIIRQLSYCCEGINQVTHLNLDRREHCVLLQFSPFKKRSLQQQQQDSNKLVYKYEHPLDIL